MQYPVQGAGLGLRRTHMNKLLDGLPENVGFMEVAPENWIDVGGKLGRDFALIAEQVTITAHGLSLNVGGPAPLDEAFILKIKKFLDTHKIDVYSDHLTYCADNGHLYDLMPIPFTEEAVEHVSQRIRQVQDMLERQILVENGSYYCAPGKEMEEIDFLNAVIEQADCKFLIDINNIFVNSVNHRYEPEDFLKQLPGDRIGYAHIAGHYYERVNFIVDTHGADIIAPVWKLLEVAYEYFGVFPTLLERDFNIPPLEDCLKEVQQIADLQSYWQADTENCQNTG